MRYELSDYEWAAIKPMLPNKPRGVPRVNDRHVLNLEEPALFNEMVERFISLAEAGRWGPRDPRSILG